MKFPSRLPASQVLCFEATDDLQCRAYVARARADVTRLTLVPSAAPRQRTVYTLSSSAGGWQWILYNPVI